ncbi:MAG: hypothetical protein KGJ35_00190 [Patescibacteria group bacterium]|nr:hypothetical protein [Patescibacteria group bacterium]
MKQQVLLRLLSYGSTILLVIAGFSLWYVWQWEYAPAYLEVDFLSLNRGHGIFIRLPNKHIVLVDGGQSGDIIRELSRLMPFYRRTIDSVLMTDAQPKSVGGLIDVIKRYSVLHLYMPDGMGTTTASEAVLGLAREKSIPVTELSVGDRVNLFSEVLATGNEHLNEKQLANKSVAVNVLFPDQNFPFSKASPAQLVLNLLFGKTEMIFAGDASRAIQNYLAKGIAATSSSLLKDLKSPINILEYDHSGGASNVSQKFIEALDPKFIIVKSSGKVSKATTLKKPQFNARSYVSQIRDLSSSSAQFFSDGERIWKGK